MTELGLDSSHLYCVRWDVKACNHYSTFAAVYCKLTARSCTFTEPRYLGDWRNSSDKIVFLFSDIDREWPWTYIQWLWVRNFDQWLIWLIYGSLISYNSTKTTRNVTISTASRLSSRSFEFNHFVVLVLWKSPRFLSVTNNVRRESYLSEFASRRHLIRSASWLVDTRTTQSQNDSALFLIPLAKSLTLLSNLWTRLNT